MKKIVISLLSLLVVACAHSPQQVTVSPVLSMEGEAFGDNRPVNVTFEDRRASKDIGSRGGIYAGTSVISIQNDIDQSILSAAKGKLAVLGFNINSGSDEATAINVVLKDISYQPINRTLGNNIEVQVVMDIELESQGETFTGEYKSKTQRQSVMAPDEEDNSKMLSDLVSQTMNRMFADPRIKAFLSNI